MEFDMSGLIRLGVDPKTGMEYTGKKDKYLSALQRLYRASENNKKKVWDYYSTGDMENFSITVHALKSNTKMIGAAELSAEFETLETAARNNDRETVRLKVEGTMRKYGELLNALKPLGEMDTLKAAGEIGAEEARKLAKELLDALDEFDDTLAAKLAVKLSGYPFRVTQREKLKEAVNQIGEFMYDEAAELIREILPEIE